MFYSQDTQQGDVLSVCFLFLKANHVGLSIYPLRSIRRLLKISSLDSSREPSILLCLFLEPGYQKIKSNQLRLQVYNPNG